MSSCRQVLQVAYWHLNFSRSNIWEELVAVRDAYTDLYYLYLHIKNDTHLTTVMRSRSCGQGHALQCYSFLASSTASSFFSPMMPIRSLFIKYGFSAEPSLTSMSCTGIRWCKLSWLYYTCTYVRAYISCLTNFHAEEFVSTRTLRKYINQCFSIP